MMVSFVYLLFATGMSVGSLGAVLQALGNLWGLSFAIMTMGYGLVEIPRFFWFRSSSAKRLQFLYFKCCELSECREAARDRVDELLYLWKKAKLKQAAPLFATEFAAIDGVIPKEELFKIEGSNRIAHPDVTFLDVDAAIDSVHDLKRKHMVRIHMLFKIWLFQLERTEAMFRKTVSDILYFEERLEMDEQRWPRRRRWWTRLEVEGIPILSKCAAVLFGAMSVAVIWSEGMIIFDFFGLSPYLSVFALINCSLNRTVAIGFGAALFMYLSSCSLFALWRIHINKVCTERLRDDVHVHAHPLTLRPLTVPCPQDYHMHPFGLTDSASMLTNAAFSMRFMFPLGLNFLMLNISNSERDPAEYPYLSLFHDMSVLPVIGDPVNVFMPMLVILFCAATYFNVYGQIMRKLRISRFEFGDPNSARNGETRHFIKEGQAISVKFSKEMANDEAKRHRFHHFIEDRFRRQSASGTTKALFAKVALPRNTKPEHDERANVALMEQPAAPDLVVVDDHGHSGRRKMQFIELDQEELERH